MLEFATQSGRTAIVAISGAWAAETRHAAITELTVAKFAECHPACEKEGPRGWTPAARDIERALRAADAKGPLPGERSNRRGASSVKHSLARRPPKWEVPT